MIKLDNNKSSSFFDIRMRFSYTSLALVFVIISWFHTTNNANIWERDLIQSDVLIYYGYLPATFICGDISLKFMDQPAQERPCNGRFWPFRAPNGGNVIQMSMGTAMLYLPFFLVGHFIALLFDMADGYSLPYQLSLIIGSFVYILIALRLLASSLKRFFSESVSAVTILCIYLATNLFYYSTYEPLMSHAFMFSMYSVLIYSTIRWHENNRNKHIIFMGLSLGLIIVARPTNTVALFIPLLYGVYDKTSFLVKLKLIKTNVKQIFLFISIIFLVGLPQLMYWKYVTGSWLYFSYGEQTFYWDNPHIIKGLFSYRKGWFVYTPIMAVAVAGIFFLRKYTKEFILPILFILPIFIYLTLSWWCWWYGGSYGQRSFIDIYPLLAFPLATIIHTGFEKIYSAYVTKIILVFLIILNIFQGWQCYRGIIHYDAMTKESYWLVFGKTKLPKGYYESLWFTDPHRAVKGLEEVFTKDEVFTSKIRIMAPNLKYICTTENGKLKANNFDENASEVFSIIPIDSLKQKVVIKNSKGKYLCADRSDNNILAVNRSEAGEWETFELAYLDNNFITLKTMDHKLISFLNREDELLVASTDSLGYNNKLRIFLSKQQ